MAAAAFFGHALLGLGPGAAFFAAVIAPKSFVVLLSLFSAFLWLLVLLATSALLRGFAPLPPSAPARAGALLAAVAAEEAARYGVWRLHAATARVLHRMSAASGHAFTVVDELYLAVGWGYGHAALHVLMLFGSLLPLTAGHGTLYTAACPQMSVFLVAALNSLGMGATLVALSVVALDAWSRGALWGKAYAPVVHAGAALLTLGSLRPGGCVAAVAAQLALGLANTWYAAWLAWRTASGNGSSVAASSGSHHRARPAGDGSRGVGLGAVHTPVAAWAEGPAAADAASAALLQAPHAAAQAEGVHDSPPPVRVLGAAAAAVVSPSNPLGAGLRSRGAAQQSTGLQ